ncbi:MAG: TonB-dependent receptor [Steroidobacteraceae bacterium]|jgi:outer membrane receptor protein involved in Fe transport|nr:TonB-dependent receptor [Steroidobacteraceae bacterium]
MANPKLARAVRSTLVSAGAASAALYGVTSAAQEQLEEIVVTGSRIVRQDFVANSPVATLSAEQITANADVTIDTFLNTLPQVNPAGGTTSNNPGNGGQSNIDLRGLGANRNLVLLDGRRLQPSASNLTVDLNTIPQAMLESVEVVTGGAGAVYGADAIAGVVNLKMKKNFEGADLRYSFSNSTEYWDAEEFNISGVFGGNFADDRGNAIIGLDYSKREGMIKNQRPFAAQATSTTSFLPEGFLQGNTGPLPGAVDDNPIPQSAVDALFATYGIAAGAALPTTLGFNQDGSLFSRGIFNSPLDVQNWRYPIDGNVNSNLFPDLYSYNFDFVNILTLPLERRSMMTNLDYRFENGVEVFANFGWTEYESTAALAPTPFPTVRLAAPGQNSPIQAASPSVLSGTFSNLVIPVTNPFIPDDLRFLLNARTGDVPGLAGAGPTEAFQIRTRTLQNGLRESNYENTVVQYLVGARGPLWGENWTWEIYASEGTTEIQEQQTGNIDTQRVVNMVEAADGGDSLCEGGFDPFGRLQLSQECIDYITVPPNTVTTDLKLNVVQGFVSGKVADLPAGPLSLVVGAESRWFKYELNPGSSAGPISGLNSQNPSKGKNEFQDLFMEALIPIVPTVEASIGYRYSEASFEDQIQNLSSPSESSDAYKVELSWQALDYMRLRGSYQKAVRAPNFSELFAGGGSAPQYFDPCSVTTEARQGSNAQDAAALRQLCLDTGVPASSIDSFVQTPGGQLSITIAGNTDLKPEEADTITLGVVFQSPWSGALEGLQASLDYYSISIDKPILSLPPNLLIADCYNYYGNNSDYDADYFSCAGIVRSGGDALFYSNVDDPDGLYPQVNGGKVETDGIDLQISYATPLPAGTLRLNFLLNYLLSFKQQDADFLPKIEYAGTVSYFGSGLGTSFPDMKMNLTGVYSIGDFDFDARLRWIDSMKNRTSVQFPGETEPTGVGSVTYLDVGVTWNMNKFLEGSSIRLGLNNATDKQPPTYAPNVQSGTEPSLYDVIGRRFFASVNFKF